MKTNHFHPVNYGGFFCFKGVNLFSTEMELGDALYSVFTSDSNECKDWCKENNLYAFYDPSERHLKREFNLSPYGYPDFLHAEKAGSILYVNILEIKNNPLSASNISQLCRYVTGVKRAFAINEYLCIECIINATLLGPSIAMSSDMPYLVNEISDYENDHIQYNIMTFSLDPINGVKICRDEGVWVKTDETVILETARRLFEDSEQKNG